MKKFLTILLCFVAAMFCVCCDLGVYTSPSGGSSSGGGGKDPVSPTDEQLTFTVRLEHGGNHYVPTDPMTAYFMSSGEILSAPFDLNTGIASITGLDGEYHVTLQGVPESYSYDNNAYMVDNDHRDVTIELVDILQTFYGVDNVPQNDDQREQMMYNNLNMIRQDGTYRVILRGRESQFFCGYEPQRPGYYTVTSWMDITANEVNPKLDIFRGSIAFVKYYATQDGGGLSSTYTKNFLFEVELSYDMIGNAYIFAVYAENRGNTYPISIDFTIRREGDDKITGTDYEMVQANGPFATQEEMASDISGKSFHQLGDENDHVLDASKVDINPEDNFYHILVDGEPTGPRLYTRFHEDIYFISTDDGSGFVFSLLLNGLKWDGKFFRDFVLQYDSIGYGSVKYHPVNREIKDFLQGYADKELIFFDGDGLAEGNPYRLSSGQDDMWLFACGYFA